MRIVERKYPWLFSPLKVGKLTLKNRIEAAPVNISNLPLSGYPTADNIAIFDRWKEYEYILENYRIFVYPRKGCLSGEAGFAAMPVKEIRYLSEAPFFDISSSAIRRSQGRP